MPPRQRETERNKPGKGELVMGKLRSTVTVHRVMEVVEAWRWFGRPASRPTNGNQFFRGVTRAYSTTLLHW